MSTKQLKQAIAAGAITAADAAKIARQIRAATKNTFRR